MPKICYVERDFKPDTLKVVADANRIIEEYAGQGFVLTLRQLYYQFVSRDLLANRTQEYQRLGSIINDARLAGLIDWEAIEDRTRGLEALAHWSDPAEIVRACGDQFRVDKWAGQQHRIEVWIEKEALAGVFARVCQNLDVPYLSCRGYTSQSEMWRAARRLALFAKRGQRPYILHFGDHDPSGIDMTRDIQDRMKVFGVDLQFERLALNMDQVDHYKPPPNPAKQTDSRFQGYIARFGDESWELDALEPKVLERLVRKAVLAVRDETTWTRAEATEQEGRRLLAGAADQWGRVTAMLGGKARDEEE